MIRLTNKNDECKGFRDLFSDYLYTSKMAKRKGKQGERITPPKYTSVVGAFDIETSDVEIDGTHGNVVYLWSFAYVDLNKTVGCSSQEILKEVHTIAGRTMAQYDAVVADIMSVLNDYGCSMIVYCHNLDYEADRLLTQCPYHIENYIADEGLSVGRHLPLFFRIGGVNFLEYRDSLKLFGSSLYVTAENYGFKKIGYDYNGRRYSDSDLSEEDWQYNENDARITVGSVAKMYEVEGYPHPCFIPLTMTARTRYANAHTEDINPTVEEYLRRGKVRRIREVTVLDNYKKVARSEVLNRERVDKHMASFAGGFTHANRFTAFNIINGVLSCDFRSCYAGAMVSCFYPYGGVKVQEGEELDALLYAHNLNMNRLGNDPVIGILENYECPVKKWFIATVKFSKLKAKQFGGWDMPLLSWHKAVNAGKWATDNGRILRGEGVTVTLTAIDLIAIALTYDFEIEAVEGLEFATQMAPLDDYKLNAVKKWYTNKAGWKAIERKANQGTPLYFSDFINEERRLCSEELVDKFLKQYKEDPDEFIARAGMELETAKQRLNSQFGIMVMAPVRDTVALKLEGGDYSFIDSTPAETKQSEIYRHGVCVTAYARLFLTVFSLFVAKECSVTPVYWDTDCAKLKLDRATREEVHKAVEKYNSYVVKVRDDIPAEIGYMDDGDGYYDKFITLGCKRYMVLEGGKIKTVVAGLPPREAVKCYNQLYHDVGDNFEELADIAFKPNTFISAEATGTLIPAYFNKLAPRPHLKGEAIDDNGKICKIDELSGYRLVAVPHSICDLSKPENLTYYDMCRTVQGKDNGDDLGGTLITLKDGVYDIEYTRVETPETILYENQY